MDGELLSGNGAQPRTLNHVSSSQFACNLRCGITEHHTVLFLDLRPRLTLFVEQFNCIVRNFSRLAHFTSRILDKIRGRCRLKRLISSRLSPIKPG